MPAWVTESSLTCMMFGGLHAPRGVLSFSGMGILVGVLLLASEAHGETAQTACADTETVFTVDPHAPPGSGAYSTFDAALHASRLVPMPRNVSIVIASPSHGDTATVRFQQSVNLTGATDPCLTIAGRSAASTGTDHVRCDKEVPVSVVQLVSDPIATARMQPEARGHVYEIDINTLDITHAVEWPMTYEVGAESTQTFGLFYNGQKLEFSRSPKATQNTSATYPQVSCENKGPCVGGIPMQAALTGTSKDWLAGIHNVNSSFQVYPQTLPMLKQWQTAIPHGLYLNGNWRVDFSVTGARVQSFDLNNRTVTFAAPMNGGIGWKYTGNNAGCGCEPFYAINALELIDQPLDYALDWLDRKIYVWLPAASESGRDPRSLLSVVDNTGPAFNVNDAQSVQFEGISIGFTYGDGLSVSNSQHINLHGLIMHDIGTTAIQVVNSTNVDVRSCDVSNVGDTGVVVSGGGDVLTLTSNNISIVNNHLWACGLNGILSGEGIIITNAAVGTYVAHNMLHHIAGIGIHGGQDTTSGLHLGFYDSMIELNEVFQVGLNGSGFGAIYSCCDPVKAAGNMFRFNFVHSSPNVNGMAWDNQLSGQQGYGNVFYYVQNGFGLNHGSYNSMRNNLIVMNSPKPGATSFQAQAGIAIACRGFSDVYNCSIPSQDVQEWVEQLSFVHINDTHSAWGSRFKWYLGDLCSEIATTDGINQRVVGNFADNNAMIYIDTNFSISGCQDVPEDAPPLNNTFINTYQLARNTTVDPMFADFEKLNLTLLPDSPIYTALPNFSPIPFPTIGLYKDTWRKNLPADHTTGRLDLAPSHFE